MCESWRVREMLFPTVFVFSANTGFNTQLQITNKNKVQKPTTTD